MLRQRQDPEGIPLHLVTKYYQCLCYTFRVILRSFHCECEEQVEIDIHAPLIW